MDIRESQIKMLGRVQGGVSVAAAFLQTTETRLRNRVYQVNGQKLSPEDSILLQAVSGSKLFAEAVAQASGGTFVLLPELDSIENDSIHALFNEEYATLGVLFSKFTEATKNGEIDKIERRELEELGAEIHRKIEQLLGLMFKIYCKDEKKPRARAAKAGGGRG